MAFLLFPVLYFLLGVSHGSANTASTLLLAFKASLPNPNLLPTWTPARSPCSFSGVTCSSSAAAAVTAVTLSSLPLSLPFLSLSSSLLSLPSLQSLTLTSANLSGPLSPFPNCPPSLTSLNLAGNRLSGGLSDLAAACPSLASLNLSSNEIDGAGDVLLLLLLPSGGGIRWLDLSGNRLSGEVPAVGNCSELRYLNLSSNHFSGKLPDDLSSCSNLESISLSNNNFSGELPVETLASMPNLRNLEFSFNNLTGFLPDSVSELSKLESIDLSSNGLSGNIPKSLCQNPNTNLGQLYLQNNQFTGAIPESLSNCSMLVSVDLSFNYLTGSIPRTLGSLSQLRDVIMWQNLLEGEIPGEIGLIKSLENLILDDNALTGSIPDGLSNCTSLNWISLSSNQLSGEIPRWIGSFGSLAILKLGNNSFSGGIPWELGDCKSLIWLDLNSNRLGGSIPGSLAKQSGNVAVGLVTGKRFVYLRNDGSKECRGAGNLLEFAGIRQDQLERLPSRRSCNFTRVYMGNTQYTFNNNGSMIFLDLSYNELGGEIPKELGEMYYLMVLNLGHNKLSGPIPPELGHLRYVGIFDLSYNSLQGPIPGSFSGLSLLSEIDLSNNKLNGTIPELGQLATFPSYRYENNSGLCGLPLPPCGEDTVSKSTGQHQKSRRRQASIVGSIALGLLLVVFCIFAVAIVIMENKKRERMRRANSSNSRDIYVDSRSHSGTANSNWKLTGTREALSISLATFDKPLRKLTFADLLEATNGFHDDSLIGSGGFGDVYKAQLKDGSVVAIKKLIHISSQGDREFMAEMETIGKIKHRNLVPLLGYCRVGEERLLVYEYMKYGSLEDVLHNRNKAGIKLNWSARRKIAVGAARGLAFLHHNCIPHIIHRDMKSSNVLIDENLEARVSDFGMARMMSAVDTHLSVSTLAGTPGYVPPEYYQSFRCTTKGDVYSYGVVLLELLTGKQPTDSSDFGDNNLVGWVKQHSKLRITDVFDRQLLKDDPKLELDLLEHLKIACACLDDRPARRPTMVKVMAMFKEIQAGSPVDSTDSVAAGSVDGTFGVAVEMSLKEAKEEKD